jgi:MFS family permease
MTKKDDSIDDERQPLLGNDDHQYTKRRVKGKELFLIQVAIFSNVFLVGFDGTFTASTYTTIGNDFNASHMAPWVTTSYLITATVFQSLYGSFSDVLGRKIVLTMATATFGLGTLGCGLAPTMFTLNVMRAVAGCGGAGLTTMATIINSDLITDKRRGIFQAIQIVLNSFGGVLGASLGGFMAENIGWRWSFLIQVPVCCLNLVTGYLFVIDQEFLDEERKKNWTSSIDIKGAITLVCGLTMQISALSVGGNEWAWSDYRTLSLIGLGCIFLAIFYRIELSASAPVMPVKMITGTVPPLLLLANFFLGLAAYSYIFMLPLYFQAVLKDSPSQAGLRFMIPSMSTPVGGVITGLLMSRVKNLAKVYSVGAALIALGAWLVIVTSDLSEFWWYNVLLVPANIGQGLAFPASLFTFIRVFTPENHAVATSIAALYRSLGQICGVAVGSAIVQNVLATELPSRLGSSPETRDLIEKIRHSFSTINTLPQDIQRIVRDIYSNAISTSFIVASAIAILSCLITLIIGIRKHNQPIKI